MNKELYNRLTEIHNYSAVSFDELRVCYELILKPKPDNGCEFDVVDDLALDAVERAVDLAAMYNQEVWFIAQEMFFVYWGSTDRMRTPNIVITERKVKKALAGIGLYQATGQEYAEARLRVILNETIRMAGAAKKLSETFNGQQKLFKLHLKELWQEIKKAWAGYW